MTPPAAELLAEVLSPSAGSVPLILPATVPDREAFYRSVLESLAEGVMITDAQWRILYANRVIKDCTGYDPEDLIGRTPHEVFTAYDASLNQQCHAKEPLAGTEEQSELEIRTKNGELRWVYFKSAPFRDQQGEIVGRVAALNCIEKQKALERENEILLADARENLGDIVGASPALKKVLTQIATVAPTEATVLVLGESGTGKELVARAVHDLSSRRDRPLIRVNCASIPKELFESEFFGHVRGAFTGAVKDRVGRFELAHGGTLFLDEIGEIPLELQPKLLRVLQEGQFERVGDERTRRVDVRVIAATNRDLLAESRAGRFRLDLYYRLSVFPIELPPLRERPEDIEALTVHFIQQAARRLGVPKPRLTKLQLQQLQAYDWPGNIRELQNVIERAVILSRGGRLQVELPQARIQAITTAGSATPAAPDAASADADLSLDALAVRERTIVHTALTRTNWKIYGADGAAALLKVKPTTLASMMKRLGLTRPRDLG